MSQQLYEAAVETPVEAEPDAAARAAAEPDGGSNAGDGRGSHSVSSLTLSLPICMAMIRDAMLNLPALRIDQPSDSVASHGVLTSCIASF